MLAISLASPALTAPSEPGEASVAATVRAGLTADPCFRYFTILDAKVADKRLLAPGDGGKYLQYDVLLTIGPSGIPAPGLLDSCSYSIGGGSLSSLRLAAAGNVIAIHASATYVQWQSGWKPASWSLSGETVRILRASGPPRGAPPPSPPARQSLRLRPQGAASPPGTSLAETVRILRLRLTGLGIGEADVRIDPKASDIVLNAPGGADPRRLKLALIQGLLSVHRIDDQATATAPLPPGEMSVIQADGRRFIVGRRNLFTSDLFQAAKASGGSRPTLLTLTDPGKARWAALRGQGDYALILDGRVIGFVRSPQPSPDSLLVTGLSAEDASTLEAILASGPLAAPLEVVAQSAK